MRILLSFDIDGTLEAGDPPGPITMDMVRKAQALGCIVGSSSDRSVSAQQSLWDRHNVQADFVSLKHKMSEVRDLFQADRYYHTGDRDMDRKFALEAGFDFLWTHEAASEPWVAMSDGQGARTTRRELP